MTPVQLEIRKFCNQFTVDQLLELGLINEARLAEIVQAHDFGGTVNDNAIQESYDYVCQYGNVEHKQISLSDSRFDCQVPHLLNKKASHLSTWHQHKSTNSLLKLFFPNEIWTPRARTDKLKLNFKKLFGSNRHSSSWWEPYLYEVKQNGITVFKQPIRSTI